MPVIELSLQRLRNLTGSRISESEIIDSLPYLCLDIEKVEGDSVSVEYSPNRPDYCSEAGIGRSLLGQLGIKVGLPKYNFPKTGTSVSVEGNQIRRVRPFIFCFQATIDLDDEKIKQLITAQEDLHNGIGRKRSKVAIGLHNASPIRSPMRYFATKDQSFSFVPLGASKAMSIEEIMEETDQGRAYRKVLDKGTFPLLVDSGGTVLSMPPIINGEKTRLKAGASSLFVDVTATSKKEGEATIAILASMVADLGAKVTCVLIRDFQNKSRHWTPDMTPASMKFDLELTRNVLGLDLKFPKAKKALQRSRLELAGRGLVLIPRYRYDILHPIDLVEEVALGYGIPSIKPQTVWTSLSGSGMARTRKDERIAEILVGLGLTEIAGFALRSEYPPDAFGPEKGSLRVENPKSTNYEYLPAEVMPSLLSTLSQCKSEEYPQKLFQESMTFVRSGEFETGIKEENHVAVVVADSRSNFSSASSMLGSFGRLLLGASGELQLVAASNFPPWFAEGRTARIAMSRNGTKSDVGMIGEISPKTINALELEVPVSGFELNLESIFQE